MSVVTLLAMEEWVMEKVLLLHKLEVGRLVDEVESFTKQGYKLDDLVVVQCDRGPSKVIVNPTNGVLRGVCP